MRKRSVLCGDAIARWPSVYERRELANGVVVDGVGEGGAPALLFLRLGNSLYDESACHRTFSAKGASGLFPCSCCKNIYVRLSEQVHDSLMRHDSSGTLHDISCADPRLFDARTNDDLWYAADLLTELRPILTVTNFQEQERFGA